MPVTWRYLLFAVTQPPLRFLDATLPHSPPPLLADTGRGEGEGMSYRRRASRVRRHTACAVSTAYQGLANATGTTAVGAAPEEPVRR